MCLQLLVTDVVVTEAPESVDRYGEVDECADCLCEFLSENERMEILLCLLESPFSNSVQDTNSVTNSEQVDKVHHILVVVLNFWELNDDHTGHDECDVEDQVTTHQNDSAERLVAPHFFQKISFDYNIKYNEKQ